MRWEHFRYVLLALAVVGLGLGFGGWHLPVGADCGDAFVVSPQGEPSEEFQCTGSGYALVVALFAGAVALAVLGLAEVFRVIHRSARTSGNQPR